MGRALTSVLLLITFKTVKPIHVILMMSFLTTMNLGVCQKIPSKEKDSINMLIDKLVENDQKYRWMIMFGTTNTQDVDSLKKLPMNLKIDKIKEVGNDKQGAYKYIKDSLIDLQNKLDSTNFICLRLILVKYGISGFLNKEKIRTLLLHIPDFIENEILLLLKNELEKGNLKPLEYAEIVDKNELSHGRKQKYWSFGDPKSIVDSQDFNCVEVNNIRKGIGLKVIRCR